MPAANACRSESRLAKKTYQEFRIEATNPGGHSSRPRPDNAIYSLAAALVRIGDYEVRGLLAEYGIVLPQAIARLRRAVPEVLEDAENELTVQGRKLVASLLDELRDLEERIKPYGQAIEQASVGSPTCQRLRSIPGIGPIGATAVVATMGDPKAFKNGRHFAAFLGLVPRQHSSGGKSQLARISRRGDVYVRRILIQGAHSILRRIDQGEGARATWLRALMARWIFWPVWPPWCRVPG